MSMNLAQYLEHHADAHMGVLISAIAEVSQSISAAVHKGALGGVLGSAGSENVQGETQKKLDIIANDMILDALGATGVVAGMASEELDDCSPVPGHSDRPFLVLFDPLDGSSNIDVNVSIGTIFSIYRRISPVGTEATIEDMLQTGQHQIAAGYVLYGSSTMLVYTTGHGVNGFTLDPSIGEFCLSHSNMKMPENGRIYAMNEGNIDICEKGIKEYIQYCQSYENQTGKPYSGRYIGSLVADFHRNMIKGGIYIYPGTNESPGGKLRLLYECNPLAFIAEQAGGLATDGRKRIMEIEPKK